MTHSPMKKIKLWFLGKEEVEGPIPFLGSTKTAYKYTTLNAVCILLSRFVYSSELALFALGFLLKVGTNSGQKKNTADAGHFQLIGSSLKNQSQKPGGFMASAHFQQGRSKGAMDGKTEHRRLLVD